ncbi:restriction endonuclease [Streptomyces sp. S07_1.15]|uniref:restriction endonuclease n=1 Tax=Streptomyces sp. S07_1.15 TaxID=2873925 RepID=UPI001D15BF37|nr:restriction endonuclease [Streptomyces sp. S07_1.15]MCC3654061.1 restriction endonuclease [Streptomyces sp. S07_1.15]
MAEIGREVRVGEPGWELLDASHELSGLPPEVARTLPATASLTLPTEYLTWESFEHLVAAVAREVEGAYEAHVYGRRGQKQHGIDVAGFFDSEKPRVYQAKHYKTYSVAKLVKAVKTFVDGKRPFGSTYLVVMTTADVSDTKIKDKLHALRTANPDLTIRLWGKQELSDMLQEHPRVVTRFFGEETARLVCPELQRPSPVAKTAAVASDAMVRGPVQHLDLHNALEAAREQHREQPARAAAEFQRVAEALEEAGFVAHALQVRRSQSEALHEAQDTSAAVAVDLMIMAGELESGEPGLALSMAHRLEIEKTDAPETFVRGLQALGALAAYQHNHDVTLDDVADAVDALEDGDSGFASAFMMFAECAVAENRLELITHRADRFEAACRSALPGSQEHARLRACLADAGVREGWEDLQYAIRATWKPRLAALLMARHGRNLILRQKATAALARYDDAIALATEEGATDDAVNWLQTQSLIRVRFGLTQPLSMNEGYRRILTLRAASDGGSVLPTGVRFRERALSRMHKKRLADASQALIAYRSRSAVTADWSGEQEAEHLLGLLHQKAQQPEQALRHHLAAGDVEELTGVAELLPEEPLSFEPDPDLVTMPNWYRVSALRAAAATADLVPDDQARKWLDAALAELDLDRPAPPRTASAVHAAFAVAAALLRASTTEQAEQFLSLSGPRLDRPPGTHRRTDREHMQALITIAQTHPTLRERAVRSMCQALLRADHLAASILNHGVDALALCPDIVAEQCTSPAQNGNIHAALALILTNTHTADATPTARRQLPLPLPGEEAAEQPRKSPSTLALLAAAVDMPDRQALSDSLIAHALNRNDAAFQRRDALHALAALAPHLDHDTRARHFTTAMDFAQGHHDGSADDDLPHTSFDRISFDLGPASLRPDGLLAAACLADTGEQAADVTAHALLILQTSDPDASRTTLVRALFQLPAADVDLRPALLAIHPDHLIRLLAAGLWCGSKDADPVTGQALAGDRHKLVRQYMATYAGEAGLVQTLAADPRRSVRCRVSQDQRTAGEG